MKGKTWDNIPDQKGCIWDNVSKAIVKHPLYFTTKGFFTQPST